MLRFQPLFANLSDRRCTAYIKNNVVEYAMIYYSTLNPKP